MEENISYKFLDSVSNIAKFLDKAITVRNELTGNAERDHKEKVWSNSEMKKYDNLEDSAYEYIVLRALNKWLKNDSMPQSVRDVLNKHVESRLNDDEFL